MEWLKSAKQKFERNQWDSQACRGYDIIFATTTMILPGLSLLFGQWYNREKITKPIFYHHKRLKVDVCIPSTSINKPVYRREETNSLPNQ
jgi:hypothetical protein